MSHSGKVFRAINDTIGAKRDRHGDPVDDDGDPVGITDEDGQAYIGTIDDIWISAITPGAATAMSTSSLGSPTRQETSDSNTTLCCPKDGIVLRYGDRVVVDLGTHLVKFEVKTNANWNGVNPLTGSDFGRFYVEARTRIG